ncbi:MAG TPA: DegT/DnrJ/EryC1/StrS aminotransferase family protein [Caulobacteraceae bacterium]|nr:DegT/DnrJ/EryC1/StrS aminotransferase family protein [Caulobacteraceae bacterium]
MIPFIDLAAQQVRLKPRIDAAIQKVLAHGAYVMGPEVRAFEDRLASFGAARRALSCGNGTDALALPLMAWEIGPGDAVFCPSFTFAATPEVIPWTGATPVFVDILPDSYNIDPDHLEAAIDAVEAKGELTPRAVIAVDLFGQPADYPRLAEICRRRGLKLIADSAQGFGCTLHGRHPVHWADAATTSFFPAKPLGGYGDGGAVLTDDERLYERMDSLRVHGKTVKSDINGHPLPHDPKYLNMRIGMNSRLDTLQAAILLEKLAVFDEEIELRQEVAGRYAAGLDGHVLSTPKVIEGGVSVWAQYVIEHHDRDGLAEHLKALGVPTAVYYPVPMHRQAPYACFPIGPGGLPVSDEKASRVLALPMHAYLTEDVQDHIIEAVRGYNG